MTSIDLFLGRFVQRGELTMIHHDGCRARFGAPDSALKSVTLRFADSGAGGATARDFGLGAGEASMSGCPLIEQSDMLDLLTLMTANDRWEAGQSRLEASRPVRARGGVRYGSTASTWSARRSATSRIPTTLATGCTRFS